jgi:hypothetical protein
VVEQRDQREVNCTGQRKNKGKVLNAGSTHERRNAEVNLTVPEPDVG